MENTLLIARRKRRNYTDRTRLEQEQPLRLQPVIQRSSIIALCISKYCIHMCIIGKYIIHILRTCNKRFRRTRSKQKKAVHCAGRDVTVRTKLAKVCRRGIDKRSKEGCMHRIWKNIWLNLLLQEHKISD